MPSGDRESIPLIDDIRTCLKVIQAVQEVDGELRRGGLIMLERCLERCEELAILEESFGR